MELKNYFFKFLPKNRTQKLSEKDLLFRKNISHIVGYNIHNLEIFKEAFSLKSSTKSTNKKNYERLEFLGDSVLGTIISCHLFQTYPNENEGFLTQMKSKIVNRKNLNKLGEDLKLSSLLQVDTSQIILSENISGNLLEALIGAIYLDIDYEFCKKIVLDRILTPSTINKLENKIISYKGLLLEWSQKKKVSIRYETCEEIQPNKTILFRCHVWLQNEKISNALEASKKKAEEKAAKRAFYVLSKKENIIENQKTIS
ncbi:MULTISPECIES: ribonuclease III [Epilithonimonas]|jgi:ribonuclease-3|uniref:Ribonuclease 3 n=2 Tax=Epilithonimonas TaxID=2782229 RepID=A0A1H6J0R5_9FLAO|nr:MULTISPECIES: ribonuclease III [Epilithonimonas]AZI54519.1 ribonuclease III [Epilithonimonas vandammei]ROI13718.1 ribonuclease III [Epilithonimonas hominis]SEH55511.1 ribonuclease-3 [Epilithonimonas hominis]HAP94789.1 ribonuclease III [Chryseobacterium sp.]